MVSISKLSPNPKPTLNPEAAPYSPPPKPMMGPSWVAVSRPYYHRPQPVVWYQLPTRVPLRPSSYVIHQPNVVGAHYQPYYRCYLYPKTAVPEPENVVDPPAALPSCYAPGGTTGSLGGLEHAVPPRFRQPGQREKLVPKGGVFGVDPCFVWERKENAIIDLQGRTSLMIRNIPNHFQRRDLMAILDDHCYNENIKAISGEHPVKTSYDCLYLPMDFKRRANLGYAFVNFTTEPAANRFWAAFNGFKWWVSRKTCAVTMATIQGKYGFIKHFRNSVFHCHTDNYLPVVFRPARDGATRSMPKQIGRRSGVFPARTGRLSAGSWRRKAK